MSLCLEKARGLGAGQGCLLSAQLLEMMGATAMTQGDRGLCQWPPCLEGSRGPHWSPPDWLHPDLPGTVESQPRPCQQGPFPDLSPAGVPEPHAPCPGYFPGRIGPSAWLCGEGLRGAKTLLCLAGSTVAAPPRPLWCPGRGCPLSLPQLMADGCCAIFASSPSAVSAFQGDPA